MAVFFVSETYGNNEIGRRISVNADKPRTHPFFRVRDGDLLVFVDQRETQLLSLARGGPYSYRGHSTKGEMDRLAVSCEPIKRLKRVSRDHIRTLIARHHPEAVNSQGQFLRQLYVLELSPTCAAELLALVGAGDMAVTEGTGR